MRWDLTAIDLGRARFGAGGGQLDNWITRAHLASLWRHSIEGGCVPLRGKSTHARRRDGFAQGCGSGASLQPEVSVES